MSEYRKFLSTEPFDSSRPYALWGVEDELGGVCYEAMLTEEEANRAVIALAQSDKMDFGDDMDALAVFLEQRVFV